MSMRMSSKDLRLTALGIIVSKIMSYKYVVNINNFYPMFTGACGIVKCRVCGVVFSVRPIKSVTKASKREFGLRQYLLAFIR